MVSRAVARSVAIHHLSSCLIASLWHRTATRPHAGEKASAPIVVETAWRCKEEMVHAVVDAVYTETPPTLGKCDWTIEVVVSHEQCPLTLAEEAAQSPVAGIQDLHVVVIAIAQGHFVEIVVDSADIIIVDIVQVF